MEVEVGRTHKIYVPADDSNGHVYCFTCAVVDGVVDAEYWPCYPVDHLAEWLDAMGGDAVELRCGNCSTQLAWARHLPIGDAA